MVDPVPLFRVGTDPAERLFERIEDVTALADDRIAVVGRGTQEIVLLDRTGRVVEVLGGLGEAKIPGSRPPKRQ